MNVAATLSVALLLWSISTTSFSSSPPPPPPPPLPPLMVPLTILPPSAASKGAVCLDGTLPGYHLHRGKGSGENSWLIHLEGGGWCYTTKDCIYRQTTHRGSSRYMEEQLPFTAILSDKAHENPDFFNWNRVKIRYCDGASFKGHGQKEAAGLYFRGQQIWLAVIDELMSKGMQGADQALLSGCSAGGLASILHCDEFRGVFPNKTRVKCLSDAGLFLDVTDVSGGHTLRNLFKGVVHLQEVAKNLPESCTSRLDPTSCFFPQNLVADVKAPLFLLNAAYDTWQFRNSLAPSSADSHGSWKQCTNNQSLCDASQVQFLQGTDFRDQMLNVTTKVQMSPQNGLFINSCFTHCQTESQDKWFANDSPRIGNKKIAEAVGDWYFDRERVEAIDCAYPCDNSCR